MVDELKSIIPKNGYRCRIIVEDFNKEILNGTVGDNKKVNLLEDRAILIQKMYQQYY